MNIQERSHQELIDHVQDLQSLIADQDRTIRQLRTMESAFRRHIEYNGGRHFVVVAGDRGDLQFLNTNQKNSRLVGYSNAEEGLTPFLERQVRSALDKGEPISFLDDRHEREGSGERCVVLIPVIEDNGTSRFVLGVETAAGDERGIPGTRHEAEELYHRLVDLQPDTVFLTDMDGYILYVNPAGVRLIGATSASVLAGRSVWEFVRPENRDHIRRHSALLGKGRRVELVEETIIRLDGSEIPIETASVPVQYQGNRAVLSTARDLSMRRQMEEALSETRELFEKSFEFGPIGLSITRVAEGRFFHVNEAFCELTGYEREQIIGKTWTDLGLWDANGHPGKILALFDGQDKVAEQEVQLLTRSGKVKSVLLSLQRIQLGGEPSILAALTDITEQQQMLSALQENEARFRSVADSVPVLLWLADNKGGFVFLNQTWRLFTGKTLDEGRGQGWAGGLHSEDRLSIQEQYMEAFDKREQFSLECRLLRHDGVYRWMHFTGVPRFAPDGVFVGYVGSFNDITERKETEIELVNAKEAAEEMARIKSAFLTNMTHEIRTPLTVILGFTSMLRQGVRPQYQRFVRVIERSGRRLLLMLDSILDLAQLEAGSVDVENTSFNVVDVVENVSEMIRPMATEKGLSFQIKTPAKGAFVTKGQRLVARVLNNLLDNAVKFTEEGGIEVEVTEREEHIYVTIRDTGIGITDVFLPHVFDEFTQESTGLERTHQGSGLGLAVSKRLLDLIGGHIRVASNKGMGSAFIMVLPRASRLSLTV